MKDEQNILDVVTKINEAWSSRQPEDVGPLFHPDVVMAKTSGRALMIGRDAMVQSLEAYRNASETLDFHYHDQQVHVFGDTAVATYIFHVKYLIDGVEQERIGRELLVLTRTDGEWLTSWRMELPRASV